MTRATYTLTAEPRADVYTALCKYAEQVGLDALMVVRERPALSSGAASLLAALRPFVVDTRQTDEWPGTQLFDAVATVIVVRPDSKGWSVIIRAAQSLFEWQHPRLPEDLCFLRRDGSTYLGTIAHEADAFLELEPGEKEALLLGVPMLQLADPARP